MISIADYVFYILLETTNQKPFYIASIARYLPFIQANILNLSSLHESKLCQG